MSARPPDEQRPSAPEHRLGEILRLIRDEPPKPPVELAKRVLDSARWERHLRSTTSHFGGFGATLIEGLAMLLGVRKARR